MRTTRRILALDVGTKRVGIASASPVAKLPAALPTVVHDALIFDHLASIIQTEDIGVLVVGLPQGLHRHDTAQTAYVRDFCEQLQSRFPDLPIELVDEALTSVEAEAEIKQQQHRIHDKGSVDARAAELILQRYLDQMVG